MGYKHGEDGLSALIGNESTPGTEATSISTKLGLIESITPKTGFDMKEGYSSMSQDRRYAKSAGKIAEFDVRFTIQNFQFLYLIMGGHSVTGTGPYTHTLTQSNTLLSSSAELIADDLGISRKILGAKANNLEIRCAEGEEIKSTMGFKGMDYNKDATPQSAAELTTDPWMYDHASIFTINSVSKIDVASDLTIKCNRNLNPRKTIGSNTPRFVKEGKRPWEISVDQYQDDTEIYDIVANETEFATQVKFVKSASSDEMTMTFNQCRIFEPGQDLPGDDVLKENFTIIPYAKSGQTLMTTTVIDSIADYSSY